MLGDAYCGLASVLDRDRYWLGAHERLPRLKKTQKLAQIGGDKTLTLDVFMSQMHGHIRLCRYFTSNRVPDAGLP